ncbi:MAG: NIPSNAP family protein [Thermoanaerobaculia bacterium]
MELKRTAAAIALLAAAAGWTVWGSVRGAGAQAPQAPSAAPAPPPAGAKVYGEWSIRVRPDKGKQYEQLIREQGLPLFRESGGRMVGWWTTVIGDLYEHLTIWEYDGMAAFEKQGELLSKDERFARFVEARDPLLGGEESRFLRLADFAEKPSLPDASKLVVHEIHRVPLGRRQEYLRFMERQLPVLKHHGFRPVGPWLAVEGEWSAVTYLFRYESLAERDQLVAALRSQAAGQAFHRGIEQLVDDVRIRVLAPARFAR